MTVILDGSAANFYGPSVEYSGPIGVEGVFVYNGLRLNDESDSQNYFHIKSITGRDDADIRGSATPNPSQHGELPGPSLYGGRTLVLDGEIRASTLGNVRNMENQLKMAFAKLQDQPLILEALQTEKSTMIYCRKSSKMEITEDLSRGKFWWPFQVTLRAGDPRFIDVIPSVAHLVPTHIRQKARSYPRTHPLNYPKFVNNFGIEVPSDAVTVTHNVVNNGTFEAEVSWEIHGRLEELAIINEITDQQLVFTGPVHDGEVIEVDGRTNVHTIVNTDGENRFELWDDNSEWLYLDSGVNPITVAVDGYSDDAYIDMNYRNSWL